MENDVRYASGQVRQWGDSVEKTRTIEFVISTADRDRHKTILTSDGWDLENYERNPIVGYQHNVYGGNMCLKADPDDIIGTSRVFRDGDDLIGAVTFEPANENEFAEKIFRKVLRGTLRSASVGFLPKPDEKGKNGYWGSEEDGEDRDSPNATYRYYGQELVEWSIVNIPSNPKAQKKAIRGEIANALVFLKRELDFPFSDIENLRVGEVVEMLEDPEKREIKHIPELIEEMVREALGDEYNEKLTLKGLFAVLRGGDAEEVEEAETGEEVDIEAREAHLQKVKAYNEYIESQEKFNQELLKTER